MLINIFNVKVYILSYIVCVFTLVIINCHSIIALYIFFILNLIFNYSSNLNAFIRILECKCVERSTFYLKNEGRSYYIYVGVHISNLHWNEKRIMQYIKITAFCIKCDKNIVYIMVLFAE